MKRITSLVSCFMILTLFGVLEAQIYPNYQNTFFKDSKGELYAFGNNISYVGKYKGILGTGSTQNEFKIPEKVLNLPAKDIQKVVSNADFHFALMCDGTVYSWGLNNEKQLGVNNDSTVVLKALPVKGGQYFTPSGYLTNVVDIQMSNSVCVALMDDGKVMYWGDEDKYTPVYIKDQDSLSITNITKISSKSDVILLLKDDDQDGVGTVYSLGSSLEGRFSDTKPPLGRDRSIKPHLALPVLNLDSSLFDNIIDIEVANLAAFAIDKDNKAWSWGMAAWGGLTGTGNFSDHDHPLPVVDDSRTQIEVKKIVTGLCNTNAILTNGDVVGWGNNSAAAAGGCFVGLPLDNNQYYTATKLDLEINGEEVKVVEIYKELYSTFLVTDDRKILAFGDNTTGALGLSSLAKIAVPTLLEIAPTVGLSEPLIYLGDQIQSCSPEHELKVVVDTAISVNWYMNNHLLATDTDSVMTNDFGMAEVQVQYPFCGQLIQVSDSVLIDTKEYHVNDVSSADNCEPSINLDIEVKEPVNVTLRYDSYETFLDEITVSNKYYYDNLAESNFHVNVEIEAAIEPISPFLITSTCTQWGQFALRDKFTKFQVYSDIRLDTVSMRVPGGQIGRNIDYQIVVFGEKFENDRFISDRYDTIYKGAIISKTMTVGYNQFVEYDFPINHVFENTLGDEGTGYWIGFIKGEAAEPYCAANQFFSDTLINGFEIKGVGFIGNYDGARASEKSYFTRFVGGRLNKKCPLSSYSIDLATPLEPSCQPFTPEISNLALQFDGVDDVVTLPDNDQLDVFDGDFTIEAIINAAPTNTDYPIILGNRLGGSKGILFGLWKTGNLYVRANSGNYFYDKGSDLRDGLCHHVALTRVSGVMTIYVDGEMIASQMIAVDMNTTTPIGIGKDPTGASNVAFEGDIKEVKIWNLGRTQQEIRSTIFTRVLSDANGLVAYYPFDEDRGQIAYDHSFHKLHASRGKSINYEVYDPQIVSKVCVVDVITSLSDSENTVVVSPNPAHDFITVEGATLSSYQVLSTSMLVVLQGQGNKIDVSTLAAGFYIINGLDLNGELFRVSFTKE